MPALTGPASPRPRASSTRSSAEHTPRSRSTCQTRPCSVISEPSGGRSPPASVCQPGRPMTSRGGCSRTPANSIRGELRSWRIASPTWLAGGRRAARGSRPGRAAGRAVRHAGRARGGLAADPGALARRDPAVRLPRRAARARPALRGSCPPLSSASSLERLNVHALHAGPKECLDSAGQLAQELTRELGVAVGPGVPKDGATGGDDCWSPAAPTADPTATRPASSSCAWSRTRRGTSGQRRLGSVRRDDRYGQASAVMDLGEAVQPPSSAACPCCSQPRPPDTSLTLCASGG